MRFPLLRPPVGITLCRLFSLKNIEPKSVFYELILKQLTHIEKSLFKEALEFAELKLEDEKIISINKVSQNFKTFSNVRNLKTKIFPKSGLIRPELFVMKGFISTADFFAIYEIYKLFKTHNLDSFAQEEEDIEIFEASRFVSRKQTYWQITDEVKVMSEEEVSSFIEGFEFICQTEY